MISFFRKSHEKVFVVKHNQRIKKSDIIKLHWLFGNADLITSPSIKGDYVGPIKEMVTPWSTNAVEITQNMGVLDIERIEEFKKIDDEISIDPMFWDRSCYPVQTSVVAECSVQNDHFCNGRQCAVPVDCSGS